MSTFEELGKLHRHFKRVLPDTYQHIVYKRDSGYFQVDVTDPETRKTVSDIFEFEEAGIFPSVVRILKVFEEDKHDVKDGLVLQPPLFEDYVRPKFMRFGDPKDLDAFCKKAIEAVYRRDGELDREKL